MNCIGVAKWAYSKLDQKDQESSWANEELNSQDQSTKQLNSTTSVILATHVCILMFETLKHKQWECKKTGCELEQIGQYWNSSGVNKLFG